MNYLEIAQFMAFAVFLTIAVIHLLVGLRAHREISHLLFAVTAAAASEARKTSAISLTV